MPKTPMNKRCAVFPSVNDALMMRFRKLGGCRGWWFEDLKRKLPRHLGAKAKANRWRFTTWVLKKTYDKSIEITEDIVLMLWSTFFLREIHISSCLQFVAFWGLKHLGCFHFRIRSYLGLFHPDETRALFFTKWWTFSVSQVIMIQNGIPLDTGTLAFF